MSSVDALRRLRLQIAALLRGRRLDADVDREMQFHVDMETERHIRDGVAPREARRRALVSLGGRERFREEARDELHSRALEDLGQDLRHAVRTFARTPALTLTVLLTLALGIGATTTIFSVTDRVVLRSLRLLAGRVFGDADRGAKRVVISENAARAMWPGENAVGKHLLVGSDTASEVIGVASDVRTTDLEHDASLTVYIPYWEKGYAPTLLVRTALDPAAISGSVRATLRDIAPSAPITRVRTMGEIVSRVTAQRRFEAVLIGLFAATALLTAMIGIYGVISHSLTRRANEISVRIALGAEPRDVHGLVLREILMPVAIGLAAGIAAAVGTGRAVSSLLFEVRPTDGATIGVVTVLLLAVAALACWVPARRATRLDPVGALRAN